MTKPCNFDLQTFLPYCLNQAAEGANREFQRFYQDRYQMTRPEWRVLAHLGQFGEMTASEISRKSQLDKTKISRAVFALEKRLWLTRRPDAQDRRVDHLVLTKAGQDVFEDLGQVALEQDRNILKTITRKEEVVLRSVLQKLAQNKL